MKWFLVLLCVVLMFALPSFVCAQGCNGVAVGCSGYITRTVYYPVTYYYPQTVIVGGGCQGVMVVATGCSGASGCSGAGWYGRRGRWHARGWRAAYATPYYSNWGSEKPAQSVVMQSVVPVKTPQSVWCDCGGTGDCGCGDCACASTKKLGPEKAASRNVIPTPSRPQLYTAMRGCGGGG
jgi:hypothetical protein